jgi:trk system potassium uptake protein TrkA
MKVIIMGCGRVGRQVARLLVGEGQTVSVIDYNPAALARLGPDFPGQLIQGIGFDREVLLRAGIEEADAFAATSSSDNANIVAARIARNIFHVPKVVARLYDPRRAEIYQRLGLVTISSTTWGAARIRELLTHEQLSPVHTIGAGDVVLLDIEAPPNLVGRAVHHLTISGELSVTAITRDNRAFIPTLGTVFRNGDVVHLTVLASALERVEDLLGLGEGGF